MTRTRRTSFCTALLVIMHVVFVAAPALALPHASALVEGESWVRGRTTIHVVAPDDPRLLRAIAAMDAAKRYGHPRSARELTPELLGRGRDASGRRLDSVLAGKSTPTVTTPLGWAPFSGAFQIDEAAHLLHRAMVGPRYEEMSGVVTGGLSATLTSLLTPRPLPPPPGAWVNEAAPDWENLTQEELDTLNDNYQERQQLIRLWWVERIVNHQTLNMTDAMVLFWHDHFATGADAVYYPMAIYGQIELLHQHALGNFKTLATDMCTDPAMLIWLNGNYNTKYDPNENFARELLELFTMGEGSGYTQEDVEEAARACTGWRTDGRDVFFVPSWYDNTNKTFLGQTGNWDMADLIDIIGQQPATAEYLCRKLYKYFLDDEPDPADVAILATTMRNNNYAIGPVLSGMLGSNHFFDPTFRGSLVKDVIDLYGGQVRSLHAIGFDPLTTTNDYERYWIDWQSYDLGQMLTMPPNVAGWPGHHNWINTATLPLRKEYSGMILYGNMWGWPLGFSVDSMAEANRFSNPNNAGALIDDVALLLLGGPPTTAVRQEMLDALLQGSQPNQWSLAMPGAANRIRDVLHFTMRLPDYQLK
ncbi:MAG: DUF1800 domain-containing protein [Candidatus Eisenbacteria bacterium]|nr:DUF1800 domain-containing protein [Candidatus Eisenbacteria bacterium]